MRRMFGCIALLVLLLGGGGCNSQYARLADPLQVRDIAPLHQIDANLPCRCDLIPVVLPNGKSIRIALHETGPARGGPADAGGRALVMIHGVASDSRSWTYLRAALHDQHIIAIDLPGCGDSDKPDLSEVGPEGYSPTMLARCVLGALQERLNRPGAPAKVTLIGHSLGGAVILRMYGHEALRSQYAGLLARVDGLIMFAPADVGMTERPAPMVRLRSMTDWTVSLTQALGLLQETAAEGEINGIVDGPCALWNLADWDVEIFSDEARRHAMHAMLDSALPERDGKLDPEQAAQWVAQYRAVHVPCLILWGSLDPALPVAMGYKLQTELPHAWLRVIAPAKHSLALERPQLSADLVRDFLSGKLQQSVAVDTLPVPPRDPPVALGATPPARSVSAAPGGPSPGSAYP